MDSIDTLIIGAGVLGLACAARLAEPGRSMLIIEQEALVGSHTSSRNSEVIHAGIYYPPGSLKAELCLEGRERLYAWCKQWQVPYRRLGKLLVAVSDQERGKLDALANNALASGVDELQDIDSARLSVLEPAVRAVAALLSPNTGIIDSHAYLQSLLACAERQGAELVLQTRVDSLTHDGDGWIASGTSAGEPFSLKAQRVINAAGLFAQQLALCTQGLAPQQIPPLHMCQGNYFNYNGKSPFSHLVYPMPEANTSGLGVHATLDLAGQLRFGPDTRYISSIDYRVDETLRDAFASAISRYFPMLDSTRLVPGYAGIRPKLSGPGTTAEDFMLQMPADHGLPGLVNLFGIESPGLTASLAIAERIAHRL
ncbi:NAD(P)/FAD-dependent oxidoreductase [Pseudomonas sp. MM211]|uniref:NAD(P)/FAD-dependent oxidoreductase n=1 Tax=Pseudomonas sp. MM211 TaxID=2866808 RepID=UPI001CECA6D0|nr:NAD(P)/FAD-dependent oxidoreductase [Pseudomonas sp. MM211]UCJ17101.1 NAD(P)/FAD-dependent oxidoreductase [Pseudomonas sp. MM211]